MTKDLLLLRHAKSSWDNPDVMDRDRGLNKRGKRDAPRMGRALSGRLEPGIVHVSPARRAQLTLGGLLDGWPALQGLPHVTDEALYTFAFDDLVEWLGTRDDALPGVFVIGHNPALTDLINWLTGDTVIPNLPTAGFAKLVLEIALWSDIAEGCAELSWTLLPRELPENQ